MNINKLSRDIWFSRTIAGVGKIEFESLVIGNSGKRKVLLMGLHGNEITPYLVIGYLLKILEVRDYILQIIPVVNASGLFTGKRMDLFYGHDYNRQFHGQNDLNLMSDIAASLYDYIKDADTILDLHNWDSPNSVFGICFNKAGLNNIKFLRTYYNLGAEFVLDSSNSKEFENTLGYKLNSLDYFVVEYPLQDFINDSQIHEFAFNISQVLSENIIEKIPILIKQRKNIITKNAGIFFSIVAPGTFLNIGETIGRIIDPFDGFKEYEVICTEGGYLLYHENRKFVWKGDTIYSIGQAK